MAKFTESNIYTIPTQTLKFSNFLGVDYFHARQDVANFRAVEMSNLIHRNGINQKRFGYKQVNHFYDQNFNGLKVNGIWTIKFTFEDVKKVKTLIHAGTNFYEMDGDDLTADYTKIELSGNTQVKNNKSSYINDAKSFGVIRGNRLYILCGLYLVYGSFDNGETFELRIVEQSANCYVPTTTIGISSLESGNNTERVTLEAPNLLTPYRINRVIGDNRSITNTDDGTYAANYWNQTSSLQPYFKSAIYNSEFTITDTFKSVMVCINNVKLSFTKDEIINGVDNIIYNSESDLSTLADFFYSHGASRNDVTYLVGQLRVYYFEIRKNADGLFIAAGTYFDPEASSNIHPILKAYQNDVVTYVLDADIATNRDIYLNKTMLTLGQDYIIQNNNYLALISDRAYSLLNISSGEANNEIKFAVKDYDEADKINKCKFGLIYTQNELASFFVSGNEDYPNADWHSRDRFMNNTQDFTETDYEDLTYFPADSYKYFGAINNAITAYSLLQDNVIAVHKEYNKNEPNMWLRKPTIVSTQVGEQSFSTLDFSVAPTAITEGAVNHETIGKLYNDNLFLSKNGIFKIQLSENLLSDVRIAVERSSIVNNRLVKEDLQNATAIVYDNRYYLSVGNGKVYVADSRFRNQVSGELPDTISYEFWIWDNVPVRFWFEHNGKLGFGTNDGRICLFNTQEEVLDAFKDVEYRNYSASMRLNTDSTNTFVINSGIEITDKDIICFPTPIKLKVFNTTLSSSEDTLTAETIAEYQQFIEPSIGKQVYVLQVNNPNGLIIGTLNVDEFNNRSFYISNDNGEKITIPSGEISIYRYTDRDYKVLSVEEDNDTTLITLASTYQYEEDDEIITSPEEFIGDLTSSITIKVIKKNNVGCYWITPSVNMGAPNINKSIYTSTLVPDHHINSMINVDYIIFAKQDKAAVFNAGEWNFNYYDFNALTFNASTHEIAYTSRKLLRNVNFILYKFYSENEYNFAIQEFRVDYKLMRAWKGAH